MRLGWLNFFQTMSYTFLFSFQRCLQYQEAKETYLLAAKRAPSSVTWLGVGISCYRLGDLEQAEDALVEANILNNLDAAVWGYLSLVCLQTGKVILALGSSNIRGVQSNFDSDIKVWPTKSRDTAPNSQIS